MDSYHKSHAQRRKCYTKSYVINLPCYGNWKKDIMTFWNINSNYDLATGGVNLRLDLKGKKVDLSQIPLLRKI